VNEEPAKVRCRTCYSDHDFRRCEIPPSKKDLKKQQLFNEVLAGAGGPAEAPEGAEAAVAADPDANEAVEGEVEQAVESGAPKGKKGTKRTRS
jgi:hypothetical protein